MIKNFLYVCILTGNQKDTICAKYKSELESVQVNEKKKFF